MLKSYPMARFFHPLIRIMGNGTHREGNVNSRGWVCLACVMPLRTSLKPVKAYSPNSPMILTASTMMCPVVAVVRMTILALPSPARLNRPSEL